MCLGNMRNTRCKWITAVWGIPAEWHWNGPASKFCAGAKRKANPQVTDVSLRIQWKADGMLKGFHWKFKKIMIGVWAELSQLVTVANRASSRECWYHSWPVGERQGVGSWGPIEQVLVPGKWEAPQELRTEAQDRGWGVNPQPLVTCWCHPQAKPETGGQGSMEM